MFFICGCILDIQFNALDISPVFSFELSIAKSVSILDEFFTSLAFEKVSNAVDTPLHLNLYIQ
jgi:hypothetical protein